MKFRASEQDVLSAEYRKKLAQQRATIEAARKKLQKEKRILCRVETDGLHLTWGGKRVKIGKFHAIRLAHSILRHMKND